MSNSNQRLPTSDKNKITRIKERLLELNAFDKYPSTDIGAAQLFSDVFKDQCRYNSTAGEWFHYNGKI